MKKIVVNETVHTVTELFQKKFMFGKWSDDCQTDKRDSLSSSIDIFCDDEEECKVIKCFLTSKGYESFHVSILETSVPKEYSIHINEGFHGSENGKILELIRKTFNWSE